MKCSRSSRQDDKKSVMCAGRFIAKLSTGTSLAFRKWVKLRHNLEALQSQKGVCCHIDVLSSFSLVGGTAACVQMRSAVTPKGHPWPRPISLVLPPPNFKSHWILESEKIQKTP